ncbi:unnamed protein product, partial [Brassica oleracea var. botrytis]
LLTEPSFKNTIMVSHIFFFFPANTSPSTTIREEISQNPNYLIQNLALMTVQNTKTTGIRSMREISLCYISRRRQEAQKNLLEEINHRKQIDQNIIEILRLSLKQTDVLDLLTSTRTTGQPVVDDWDCYKTLVKSFKNQCGAKMEYDMMYARALANICNMGVDVKESVAAIEEPCAH